MQPLLVVIDPVSRRADGESVRVARDVLEAGARLKIAIPEGRAELEHMFAHRGRKRPVVVGDDRALRRVVELLWRRGELADTALAMVPVGAGPQLALCRSLGVPCGAVGAARAVLDGVERRLDLVVDDRGGVLLGPLRVRPPLGPMRHRVRVFADGDVVPAPRGRGVTAFDERPDDGCVDVRVGGGASSVHVRSREVRVSGVSGPAPTRTWRVVPHAWALTVPS